MSKTENLTPYEPKDYFGEFNLLRHEKEHIKKVLTLTKGDIKRTSKLIEVPEKTLYRKIHRHRLVNFVVGFYADRKDKRGTLFKRTLKEAI